MRERFLSRDEVRNVDRRAIDEFGIPGIVLMENAGRGAAELLIQLGINGPVVICVGKGNNGGDGFVVARHLDNHGYQVKVLLFSAPEELSGDAAINYQIVQLSFTSLCIFTSKDVGQETVERELEGADWIVDALLGTGVQGSARKPYATVIDCINEAEANVMAIDLPSGLDCDTGQPLGVCVKADHTATFVARKLGFEKSSASAWTGVVHVVDIGAPRILLEG